MIIIQSVINTNIRDINGIGEVKAKYFERLGIHTVGDILNYFPRTYEDRTNFTPIYKLQNNLSSCVKATVCAPVNNAVGRSGIVFCRTQAMDSTGTINFTFFNAQYVKGSLIRGHSYVFYGKAQVIGHNIEMINPVFEEEEKSGRSETAVTGRILPIYHLTAGLTNNAVMKAVLQAQSMYLQTMMGEYIVDVIPTDIRRIFSLCPIYEAYRMIHFPDTQEQADTARRRFVFEELFMLTLGLSKLKSRRMCEKGTPIEDIDISEFVKSLPFTLTDAQQRCIDEALFDMSPASAIKPPMRRLIQGDVGSGKTMVAAACAYVTVKNGHQSVLMAPTEILANQHFRGLSKLLSPLGINVELLTGSMNPKTKHIVMQKIADGTAGFVIGTHAVLNQNVVFSDLRLVITDEQHRFGVHQRAAISEKGENVHMLVMSATPIPRTLALMVYGDLDVSVIDELPPGRIPIYTRALGEEKRDSVYEFMRRQFKKGHQGYVVCPLIEDNDGKNNMKAVGRYADELKTKIFPEFCVEYLHGRMSGREKNEIMARFAANEISLLVSTTVIEVGVDVPNASIMVIENAERFGLSQLHQLRGRIGRGSKKGYCVLFCESQNEDTLRRLQVMEKTSDGFEIAREDLAIRGPGDFFGERQSGVPCMKIASLGADMSVLSEAQRAARELLASDPQLSKYKRLREKVAEMFIENGDIFN